MRQARAYEKFGVPERSRRTIYGHMEPDPGGSECVLWNGSLTPSGLPIFSLTYRRGGLRCCLPVRRFTWYEAHGKWPDKGSIVHAACGVGTCVSAAHLEMLSVREFRSKVTHRPGARRWENSVPKVAVDRANLLWECRHCELTLEEVARAVDLPPQLTRRFLSDRGFTVPRRPPGKTSVTVVAPPVPNAMPHPDVLAALARSRGWTPDLGTPALISTNSDVEIMVSMGLLAVSLRKGRYVRVCPKPAFWKAIREGKIG